MQGLFSHNVRFFFKLTHYLNSQYEPLGAEIIVRALVHVSNFTETDTVGEDRFGQEITDSYNVRSYRVKQIKFSSGRQLKIGSQDESMDDSNHSTVVEDVNGSSWSIDLKLKN